MSDDKRRPPRIVGTRVKIGDIDVGTLTAVDALCCPPTVITATLPMRRQVDLTGLRDLARRGRLMLTTDTGHTITGRAVTGDRPGEFILATERGLVDGARMRGVFEGDDGSSTLNLGLVEARRRGEKYVVRAESLEYESRPYVTQDSIELRIATKPTAAMLRRIDDAVSTRNTAAANVVAIGALSGLSETEVMRLHSEDISALAKLVRLILSTSPEESLPTSRPPVTGKVYRTEHSIGWDVYEGETLVGFTQLTRGAYGVDAVSDAVGPKHTRSRRMMLIALWRRSWERGGPVIVDGLMIDRRCVAFRACPNVT